MRFDKPIIPTQANLFGKTGKEALVLVSDEFYQLILDECQSGVGYIQCDPKRIDPETVYYYNYTLREYRHPAFVNSMEEEVDYFFGYKFIKEQYITLLVYGITFETYSFENIFRASDVLGKEEKIISPHSILS